VSECKHVRQERAGYSFTTSVGIWQCPWCEIDRLRDRVAMLERENAALAGGILARMGIDPDIGLTDMTTAVQP
jgi:hypothetical protein